MGSIILEYDDYEAAVMDYAKIDKRLKSKEDVIKYVIRKLGKDYPWIKEPKGKHGLYETVDYKVPH